MRENDVKLNKKQKSVKVAKIAKKNCKKSAKKVPKNCKFAKKNIAKKIRKYSALIACMHALIGFMNACNFISTNRYILRECWV